MFYPVLVMTAQDLEPRAYSVSPKDTNFVVLGFTHSSGSISFDPTLPIENASASLNTSTLGCVHTFGLAGRSASVGVVVPYLWGTAQGSVNGTFAQGYRSGLADSVARFAINLHGARAMDIVQYKDYRQKTNVGASVVVVFPTGQYDPARVMNISSNRWAMKPEIGMSRRFGRWYFDVYLACWLFTPNNNFRGGVRRQDPIGSTQVHVSYNIKPRLWASFDVNYYIGGRTSFNDKLNADLQRNSRVGGTLSIPVTKHQSIKFNISTGAIRGIGADFTSVGVAYQYFWIGKP